MPLTAIEKINKLGKAVHNMTQADLARAVGVSRERIRQLMPRLKLKPGKRIRAWHRTISVGVCEAMARLHDRGMSLTAIGAKYGVSDYHVREAIRRVRPKLEPAGRVQRMMRQQALRELLKKGVSFEEACDRLKFSDLQRRRYRRQMGYSWQGNRTVPIKRRG